MFRYLEMLTWMSCFLSMTFLSEKENFVAGHGSSATQLIYTQHRF